MQTKFYNLNRSVSKQSGYKILGLILLFSMPVWVFGSEEPAPDPKYSPAEVVQIQMIALKDIDHPVEDAGFEITYRFASPDNKAQTGPLQRFKTLFDNPVYSPMLRYSSLEIGPTQNYTSSANVPIIITAPDGTKAAYIFRLNKQTDSPYQNCWMTSAVIRVELDDPI